jgi:hypothetical protein
MSEENLPSVAPFWLVVVGESFDDPPTCIECKDQEAFNEALKTYVLDAEGEIYAFAFQGQRIMIGSLQPVGAYMMGDKRVTIGKDHSTMDASGRIMPLIPKPRKA